METLSHSYCYTVEGECVDIDTEKLLLKSKNVSDLLRIQEVMSTMEGREYTLDQVMERVIGFYGRYVPFS